MQNSASKMGLKEMCSCEALRSQNPKFTRVIAVKGPTPPKNNRRPKMTNPPPLVLPAHELADTGGISLKTVVFSGPQCHSFKFFFFGWGIVLQGDRLGRMDGPSASFALLVLLVFKPQSSQHTHNSHLHSSCVFWGLGAAAAPQNQMTVYSAEKCQTNPEKEFADTRKCVVSPVWPTICPLAVCCSENLLALARSRDQTQCRVTLLQLACTRSQTQCRVTFLLAIADSVPSHALACIVRLSAESRSCTSPVRLSAESHSCTSPWHRAVVALSEAPGSRS